MTVIERRQEAIDALLGVLNDIGGGQRDNFNVSYEAAGLAVDAVVRALNYEGAVEALHRAHAALDAEHGHTAETWADRERFGPPPTGGQ